MGKSHSFVFLSNICGDKTWIKIVEGMVGYVHMLSFLTTSALVGKLHVDRESRLFPSFACELREYVTYVIIAVRHARGEPFVALGTYFSALND